MEHSARQSTSSSRATTSSGPYNSIPTGTRNDSVSVDQNGGEGGVTLAGLVTPEVNRAGRHLVKERRVSLRSVVASRHVDDERARTRKVVKTRGVRARQNHRDCVRLYAKIKELRKMRSARRDSIATIPARSLTIQYLY